MPLVKVEIFEGKSKEYKKALLDGIHNALVDSLKVPIDDRMQRLYELNKENFEIKSDRTENFTLIEITIFKGRSNETKKRLYQEIVKNLESSPEINGYDILIVINEPPLENWEIRGGFPANEIDLGFNIKI